MIRVRLTSSELLMAAQAGCFRHVEDVYKQRDDRYGANRGADGWRIDIQGAAGEMALAKALKLYWSGKGVLGAPDVGEHQARTITNASHSLLMHKSDEWNRRFYLVHYNAPEFTIIGYILGKDAKMERWWSDPTGQGRPAYFVPQDALHVVGEVAVPA